MTRAALSFVVLCVAGVVPWGGGAWAQRARRAQPRGAESTRARGAKAKGDPAQWRAALEQVSAESMKGHLSFLASDALEGRKTPSRGLDIAAEYIAAQFRRAGLEPAGDDGYFQTANWPLSARDVAAFRLSLSGGPAPLVVARGAEAAADVRTPAANETAVRVRNVAGLLRGSDPALRDTYVIVSAHYDHLGLRENCDPSKDDCVYNGANDNGSGTVGVVELASALSKLNPRPRRSILFLTFFGEELGLVGSRFYGRRPLVPLEKTIAQVNFEVIGRTDDREGPQVGTMAVTGFDYSEVGAVLQRAGESEGVRVYKHPTKSDSFFGRSDNRSLADSGVPAHTVSAAFEYPDYHGVGDEWQKVDFANMARVVRTAGRGVLALADSPQAPRWNEQNPKAAPYVEAWKKLHGR